MKYRLTILTCFIAVAQGMAQTTNSPYSVYSIGDLATSQVNRTTGLGSTGIAYRSHRNIITNNPASLSALDNQFFAGELGVSSLYTTYSGTPVGTNNTSGDIKFSRFTIGTKIFKHLGSAIGLAPFSTENYESNGYKAIGYQGTLLPTSTQGYGGINKVFWALGYEFFNHLSVGITSSYLFGSVNTKEILQGNAATAIYLSKNTNTFYSNLYFDYGMQYHGSVGSHWDYSLGAIYASKQNLSSETNVSILGVDSTNLHSVGTQGTFAIPAMYGGGISLTKDKKYTFLADYKYQYWQNHAVSPYDNQFTYQNSQRYSAGFEISKQKAAYNTYYETSFIQFGVYYEQTYILANAKQIDDMGLTAGFGVNAKRSPLSMNVILQYGIKGTTKNDQIRSSYVGATFIFSYRDFWLTHGRRFE